MQFPDSRILIFAKAPVPGQVKTRLIPAVGANEACRLHRRMLEAAVSAAVSGGVAPVNCWCAPSTDHPDFRKLAVQYGIGLECQTGVDLGERMRGAAEATLHNAGSVLLTGTDCPGLTPSHFRQALEWLNSGSDAVLGPAEDGGYVLLGLRRIHPTLFNKIPWGDDQVLSITRSRLVALGWKWQELETLQDIDRPEDLDRYRKRYSP
ncbi:MAG: glycosyltransferase [Gammaproteobacteria bacterium]|nr:glycosyltransferase [Gammaproteobacteria bacterium]